MNVNREGRAYLVFFSSSWRCFERIRKSLSVNPHWSRNSLSSCRSWRSRR